jgi:ABC-2 type transport system ATP-binding protein
MVTINNLQFSYGSHEVFSNLNLTFDEGKIYGLLGMNGAGKSTLLYLMSGLLFAKQGSVDFNGHNMSRRSPSALADLFIVPEEFDLPAMTFERYIKLNAPFYPNFSQETLERCLHGFDMSMDMNLERLSMGQKKKAFVCFALACNTGLLLMDEPTNGLDIPSKSQFRKVVAECMTDNRTIIISTHQVRDVENLIDNITIVGNRQLLFDMPVAQICDHLTFADCKLGQQPEDAIYTQPSAMGCAVVCKRTADDNETPLDIELLFNAVLANTESVKQAFAVK